MIEMQDIIISIFKKCCDDYFGTYKQNQNELTFNSNNKIRDYYADGTIHCEKIVPCVLGLRFYDDRILFFGEEKTFAIIGGFSMGFSEEDCKRQLERYNFKKKQQSLYQQISMFNI